MSKLVVGLTLLSAVTALGAAVFWFLSAAGDLPPMLTYWDKAPPGDPLYRALQSGVRMNRIAAALSGCSAFAYCAATLVSMATDSH